MSSQFSDGVFHVNNTLAINADIVTLVPCRCDCRPTRS
jgi:hypothetical protein